MKIYKVDGKLIKSGAKFNAFIKAKSIAKYGHVVVLEVLKQAKVEAEARTAALKADPNSNPPALKTKQEVRALIEADLGGEMIEVS